MIAGRDRIGSHAPELWIQPGALGINYRRAGHDPQQRRGRRAILPGWAPAPDQFALAALERTELGLGPRAPVIAEIALVSSHAPWTPLPTSRPWSALGDGSDWQPFECPAVARALNGARDPQDKMFLDLVARHYCAP